MVFFSWCRLALRACGCDDDDRSWHLADFGSSETGGAPRLKCYYDVSDALVMRQLEYRKMRKTARDASTNSLSSLGSLSEDLEDSMPLIQATPDSSFLMSLSRSGSDARLAPELVLPVTPPGSFKTILDSR